MKAGTGRRANTMNGGEGIAYQVDSRHSRIKWIGPYEGGSRAELQRRRRGVDRSKRRLSRWLFNYDNLLEGRRRGGDRYAFHAPARFVSPPVAHPVSR